MSVRAGFGIARITPEVPVKLAGFGDRTQPADRVHDELEARAMVLDDGDAQVCLLVLDLLGMSSGFADPVRAAVAEALGIDRSAVLTSCTHTHHGPNAIEGAEVLGWDTPDGYGALLIQRCIEAARAARDGLRAADAFALEAPLPDGVSFNRRNLPYEPWFTALDLRGADGDRIGCIANISIHPVSHGSPWLAVSTDWVGPFRSALEERVGGTAVMLSGALGDVNPVEHHTDVETHLAESAEEAASIGRELAGAVAAVLPGAVPVTGALAVATRSLTVSIAPTVLGQLLGRGGHSVELVEWALGHLRVVGIPGEAFHALGRAITDARGNVTLLAGLAPTWDGYLPMPYGDGYEETVSLGPAAVEAIGAALIEGAAL